MSDTLTAETSFNSIKVRLRLVSNLLFVFCFMCFNSIKVRLRPRRSRYAARPCLFQFHKGSIKTLFGQDSFLFPFLFQFHKGSIKTGGIIESVTPDVTFQFHKGSIKTMMAIRLCRVIHWFQFHKGSIKTDLFCALVSHYAVSIP